MEPDQGGVMGKKLEFWGAVGTASYLIVIFMKVFLDFEEFQGLKLNELGDFLAGVFGPVAFFWLVLGFLQQGRELKLSTEALQIQAQELKNSVEQQSIMAAAATQQIESQRAALRLQEKEIERSISAVFTAITGYRQGVTEGVKTSVQFKNSGFEARAVSLLFDPSIGGVDTVNLGKLTAGSTSANIEFVFPASDKDRDGVCMISYLRSDGKHVSEEFTYSIPSNNPFVFIEKRIPTIPA